MNLKNLYEMFRYTKSHGLKKKMFDYLNKDSKRNKR